MSADALLWFQGAGRRQNLEEFLAHMPAFLDMVGVSNFRVIVVEQVRNQRTSKSFHPLTHATY